ncbi:WD repeat-containing protein rup2 [Turnera subulata]|uniref:WD repeat-containing protein rup2 n=1 Tax=Turnera subulata TaxID=218843 RepID=A0A9Q0FU74_9ROSI|nr:WD repeat-containing protein rup2 [Turnera subulata]
MATIGEVIREEAGGEGGEAADEERARCEWDFRLSSVVSSSTPGGVVSSPSDALGVIEFDPTHTILATGGIARKIRIYRLKSLLPAETNHQQQEEEEGGGSVGDNINNISYLDHATACDYYICTPAKLSSLRWKPRSDGRLVGSGDYDGVVTEYDLESRVPVFERDEHGGRRVWALDYSHWEPAVGASGSDDGTVQMWDARCEGRECAGRARPSGAAVCCVEFNPFGGWMLAAGCADRKAYGYDVRRMGEAVAVMEGHRKTVTYVRFMEGGKVATAGADGCLKLWDLEGAGGYSRAIRTYRGHVNSRNFVGLSVWREGGLLGCGSESGNNQVFVYDKRWGDPVWVASSTGTGSSGSGFVSSVCWRQAGDQDGCCTLVTGASDGVLQVKQQYVSSRDGGGG